MRVILQRVRAARVEVEGQCVGEIEQGLLLFVGIAPGDTEVQAAWLAKKISGLRIFPDEAGKMNRSLLDMQGRALVVSQFTLFGDCSRGRRPSFIGAAPPTLAERLYLNFGRQLVGCGVPVEYGRFGADMQVSLVNDGPVTLLLERE